MSTKLDIKLSVCIITYNHEKYIAQAIESVLMQRTSFEYEIVIGEDDSSDNTRQIVKEYKSKYPDKIRIFLNDRKNVIYINGQPTGRWNLVNNLKHARGKYIALLDGDDYWTHPYKLQKQVDVLERHPECIACHHWHKHAIRDESGKYIEIPAPKNGKGYFPQKIGTVRHIFANRLRIKSRTVMFRNIFGEINFPPEWFMHVMFGDVPLSMILGEYGDFYFIDYPMAVYRQTGKGVSTAGHPDPATRQIQHLLNWISIWDKGNKHYNYAYNTEARNTIFNYYRCIFRLEHCGLLFGLELIKARINDGDIPYKYRIGDAYRMAILLYKARIYIKITRAIKWSIRLAKKIFIKMGLSRV